MSSQHREPSSTPHILDGIRSRLSLASEWFLENATQQEQSELAKKTGWFLKQACSFNVDNKDSTVSDIVNANAMYTDGTEMPLAEAYLRDVLEYAEKGMSKMVTDKMTAAIKAWEEGETDRAMELCDEARSHLSKRSEIMKPRAEINLLVEEEDNLAPESLADEEVDHKTVVGDSNSSEEKQPYYRTEVQISHKAGASHVFHHDDNLVSPFYIDGEKCKILDDLDDTKWDLEWDDGSSWMVDRGNKGIRWAISGCDTDIYYAHSAADEPVSDHEVEHSPAGKKTSRARPSTSAIPTEPIYREIYRPTSSMSGQVSQPGDFHHRSSESDSSSGKWTVNPMRKRRPQARSDRSSAVRPPPSRPGHSGTRSSQNPRTDKYVDHRSTASQPPPPQWGRSYFDGHPSNDPLAMESRRSQCVY